MNYIFFFWIFFRPIWRYGVSSFVRCVLINAPSKCVCVYVWECVCKPCSSWESPRKAGYVQTMRTSKHYRQTKTTVGRTKQPEQKREKSKSAFKIKIFFRCSFYCFVHHIVCVIVRVFLFSFLFCVSFKYVNYCFCAHRGRSLIASNEINKRILINIIIIRAATICENFPKI